MAYILPVSIDVDEEFRSYNATLIDMPDGCYFNIYNGDSKYKITKPAFVTSEGEPFGVGYLQYMPPFNKTVEDPNLNQRTIIEFISNRSDVRLLLCSPYSYILVDYKAEVVFYNTGLKVLSSKYDLESHLGVVTILAPQNNGQVYRISGGYSMHVTSYTPKPTFTITDRWIKKYIKDRVNIMYIDITYYAARHKHPCTCCPITQDTRDERTNYQRTLMMNTRNKYVDKCIIGIDLDEMTNHRNEKIYIYDPDITFGKFSPPDLAISHDETFATCEGYITHFLNDPIDDSNIIFKSLIVNPY